MKPPVLYGTIRRRILANWRIDPAVVQKLLPHPLRPKLQGHSAIAGVCLIRLEHIRPELLKAVPVGIDSENAAHRIAIEWEEGGQRKEGVFIWRRDSNSWLNHFAGGRIFPGVHGAATFEVSDDRHHIDFKMKGADVAVSIDATEAEALHPGSVFHSLSEVSAFFEAGSSGYSVTDEPTRLDGMHLITEGWKVAPLAVASVSSSFFSNQEHFPVGSAVFDHAIVMRDIQHHWEPLPDLAVSTA